MNRPKNQHWVPQFYLRQFATPETRGEEEAQVWTFSRDESDGEEVCTNVRNVCAKRFLYTPLDEYGERDWNFEEKLGDLESLLGQIWPALANGYPDLSEVSMRKGLSLFVAVMSLRNFEKRKEVEGIHQRLVEAFSALPIGPDGIPSIHTLVADGKSYEFDPSGWKEYREWGKKEHDRFFVEAIQSEAVHIAELLMKKRWSVVVAEADAFITTDQPVALHHADRDRFGFKTKGTLVSFPLSPTRLLIMDDMHEEPENQFYPLVEGRIGAFNYMAWINAKRALITGRPVPDVLGEMVAWADRQRFGPSTMKQ
ncbi:DUF4238 domain-containing protein [Geothrix fermentans]|uniref:DUF4238 domain-containing protein n=1 Tax=Geothrix fermentans TaxID=44676 RepID=UPI0009FBD31B|nr:DUF4238 domain-containing protein [Geothrix fermentans]